MRTRLVIRFLLLLVLLAATDRPARPAHAQTSPVPGPRVEGVLPSGALNDGLVVWGHGYVAFYESRSSA